MFIEVFRGNDQPSEGLPCLAVLKWKKSRNRVATVGLMEKSPVHPPSVTIRQECGHEIYPTPRMINLNSFL